MRKIFLLAAVAAVVVIGTVIVIRHGGPTEPGIKPEVLSVSGSQVTIAWLSRELYKGRVLYKPAGSDGSPLSAEESFGASDQHEVVIAGLSPSTRYTYWIEGSETHFQFQTQPLPNTPFSFLTVWGDVSKRIVPLMMSEVGEFIVSLSNIPEEGTDRFSDVRPYVPIYGPLGIDSVFLRAIESERAVDRRGAWHLDWGGLRLIFVDEVAEMAEMFETRRAHTFGIITTGEVLKAFKASQPIDIPSIQQAPLHSILTAHNKANPTRPAAFVGVVGREDETVEVDGVQYFGIDKQSNADGAIRIDVDVESARAVFIDENREVALKKQPLSQKRTCEECRRLADKGAYEESVKAYKEFIATHKGHFQIDDAYFAIAGIFDEKLFRFAEALVWYRRLIDEYPDGTLGPLAKQRVKYLTAYSDYDYEPLVRFERIRKVEFARRKHRPEERNKLLAKVESIIGEYSDSKLAPVMQHWLAKQYGQGEPDKAVDAYRRLRKKYPGHPEAQEVLIEIGLTYYEAQRYDEAMEAYSEALRELPSLRETIEAQVARCKRNIRRTWVAWICWGVFGIFGALGILAKPAGIIAGKVMPSLAAFVVMGMLLSFGAWLIYEQFSSVREMLLIIMSFSAMAAVSSLISTSFTEKFFSRASVNTEEPRVILPVAAGCIIGMILFATGIYLAIYYINVHYLIVLRM